MIVIGILKRRTLIQKLLQTSLKQRLQTLHVVIGELINNYKKQQHPCYKK